MCLEDFADLFGDGQASACSFGFMSEVDRLGGASGDEPLAFVGVGADNSKGEPTKTLSEQALKSRTVSTSKLFSVAAVHVPGLEVYLGIIRRAPQQ